MRIFYSKERFHSMIRCINLFFLSVFCKNVIFYSIENTDIGLDYVEKNEGINCLEFKLESKYISNTFKSVYLLQNRYLKCIYRNNSLKYYIPHIVEISDFENIILDLFANDDEHDNILARKIFIGQISYKFLLRFTKYATNEDSFINVLSFIELMNILTVLEILGFKRTKNNKRFLKYLLVSSIMNENFDIKLSNMGLNSKEYDYNISNLEYLFSVLLKFIFIEKMTNFTFLLLQQNSLSHDCKIILSSQFYLFYRDKLFSNNIFILEPERILHLEKVLNLAFGNECICFFIKYCQVDIFWIRIADKNPGKKIFDLFRLVKPIKLKKLVIADKLLNKNALKSFMYDRYFDITEFLKIKCDLNVEEICIVLEYCEKIKRLVIECSEASYDVLVVLNKFALNHKNIYLKYKCINFQMKCTRNDFLKNISNNLIFYVEKFHDSFIHCDSCYSISYSRFRRIITKLDKHFLLEEHKKKFKNCLNTKEVNISTMEDQVIDIFRPTLFKYIFKMPNLESLTFENIIFTEILIRYILESKKVIYLRLYNSFIPFNSYFRCKVDNTVLQCMTIKKSVFTFNMDFINFLLSFHNLSFLKININDISETFENSINECTCTYDCFKDRQEEINSKLDYLKITIDENITRGLPIIFALSHFFNFSNLNVLVLEIFELHEKDAIVISNLKNLKKIHISIYLQRTEMILGRLSMILGNSMIKWIGLNFIFLDIMIFKFLHTFKNIEYVFIHFKTITRYDLDLLDKQIILFPSNIALFCRSDGPISSNATNFYNEYNIGFSVN